METSRAGREADDGSAGGLWKLQSSMTSKEDMLKTEGCVELSEERKKRGSCAPAVRGSVAVCKGGQRRHLRNQERKEACRGSHRRELALQMRRLVPSF